jgi:CelD/BcsL family acetyltransferase involved in cellulose biosynthesis
MSKLSVSALPPEQFPEWVEFVRRSPDGSVYAEPAYLQALTTATGANFRIIGVRRAGELVGGVPLYETRSRLQGHHAGPRLLLYYHGPLFALHNGNYPSQQTSRDLEIQGVLLEHLSSLRFDSLILKSRSTVRDARTYLDRGWHVYPSYTYVVPLTDLRQQWQRVEGNLRRLIKRCTEVDELEFTDDEDFDSFFRLHSLTLGRRGVATYLPLLPFRRFVEQLRAAGIARLQHARLPGGAAIASQLVLLGKHPVSHTVCAGMDPNYSRLGASAFLRWRGFEALAGLGYEANDLTDAALNSVTHFKSQLGGNLETALVLTAPRSPRRHIAQVIEDTVRLPRAVARRLLRPFRRDRK